MADYLTYTTEARVAIQDLSDRLENGSIVEEVECMSRGELEAAYINVIDKYVDLAERFYKRLTIS